MAAKQPRRPDVPSDIPTAIVLVEHLAEAIVDAVRIPLVLLDADFRIRSATPAFYETFQVGPELTVNRVLFDVGNGQWEIPALRRALAGVAETGTPLQDFEVEHDFPGVGARTILLNARQLRQDAGSQRTIVLALEDITVRRQAERDRVDLLQRERTARAEAEAANRAKDDFLSVLSHELRTPLTAMLGWARVLRTGALDPARTDNALETVERNTRLLAQLIDDLLDVSRIASGKLVIETSEVDLGPVVRAAAETVRDAAEGKGLTLGVEVAERAPVVRGDRRRLQQVVSNLLSNALKFTPSGGRVDVRLESLPSSVRLTVSDTGRGITTEFLPRIFDRFRQFESLGTRTQTGLGLGLAIVRHLVELHGGRVAAFSAGQGLGSTFTVDLPQAG